MKIRIIILGLLVFSSFKILAQKTRENFGKNRLQYINFDWKYYSSTNFDLYYYNKGNKIARKATEYLEKEFERITNIAGYNPYFKAKIFIYNSVAEMQQSNIGFNSLHRAEGKVNFVKNYIEIANPGSIVGLKKELVLGLSELVLNDMLFGGNLSDMFQNTYLMSLSDWFVQGAIAYLAKGWDIEMDDRVRDFMSNGGISELNKLKGKEAILIGQSLWNFIVQKYGKKNVNQILNLVRMTRDAKKGIYYTLGVPFQEIMLEWRKYYTNMLNQVSKSYNLPNKSDKIFSLKKEKHLSAISLNKDATKLAYAITKNAKYKIFVRNLQTGNVDKISGGGYQIIDQKTDNSIPILDWQNNHTLGVVMYKKGNYYLSLYDTETKKKIFTPLRNLERINNINFSGNGRLAVLSANRGGKTDIYLLSVRRQKIRRLTNDHFDDVTPTFIPNSNTIIFSSNRLSDTLKVDEQNLNKLNSNFNIFTFNLDTTKTVLSRITNTISYDFAPRAKNKKDFFYLSNQKGITNLFRYNMAENLYSQVSNFSQNIRKYDVNFDNNMFVYVVSSKQKEQIYLHTNFNFFHASFTPSTPRKKIQQIKKLSSKKLEEAKKQNNKPKIDTVKVELEKEDTGLIDTDNYVFDKEVIKKKKKTDSFLNNYKRTPSFTTVKGPFTYEPMASMYNFTVLSVVDPIRGFGILLESQINDILGNHKFLLGAVIPFNFKSGDVYVEYQYLKKLVDYSVKYKRKSWFINKGGELLQKYDKDKIEIAASFPFTTKSKIVFKPSYTHTRFQDLNPLLLSGYFAKPKNKKNSYLGIAAEFVYDNSFIIGKNIIQGTKFKLGFFHNESLEDKSRTFDNLSFDFRHYQKIYRSLVFATRVYYGSFFGKYTHNYLLGGMDNWLFKNKAEKEDPWLPKVGVENQNLYFLQHATSLRGFNYNTFYGANVLLANFELRIPIASLLYSGPVSHSFVKNFQVVGFFDIGSSWTGRFPFSKNNSISTVVIRDNNFKAKIETFKNPWLMGYGVGIRSIIFGYFLKFDLALPYEDNQIGNLKFYMTLGHDF